MRTSEEYVIQRPLTSVQVDARRDLVRELDESRIPSDEVLDHLAIYSSRHGIGRVLVLHELYQHILDVHGSILVFGVRWGRDLAILQTLRSLLEPYNSTRTLVGFDTFEGFPSVTDADADAQVGDYAVADDHEATLDRILSLRDQESGNPYPRRQVVVGDASVTFPRWLDEHPETVVAMAYFDMDLYAPTRACLTALRPLMPRGSLVGLDEVAHPGFPGETRALREVWGLPAVRLRRTPYAGGPSYFVVE